MKVTSPIFISYSSLDKDTVYPIVERIEKECGIKCWIDRDGLHSGDMLDDSIMDAIEASETVLFMMSDKSISSGWVRNEVLYASSDDVKKRIIPLSLDGKGTRRWFKFNFPNIKHVNAMHQEHLDKLIDELKTLHGTHHTKINQGVTESKQDDEIHFVNPERLVFNIADGIDLIMEHNAQSPGTYIGELPINEILSVLGSDKDSLAKEQLKDITINMGLFVAFPLIAVARLLFKCGKDIFNTPTDSETKDKLLKIRDYTIKYVNEKFNINLKPVENNNSNFSATVVMITHNNQSSFLPGLSQIVNK